MSAGSHSNLARASLRICFASGDRPHLFWLAADRTRKLRYKILSKRLASGEIELLVLEEAGDTRRVLAHKTLEPGLPSGWLQQWVARLGRDLEVLFRCYDLRDIETADAWSRTAEHLGWRLPSGRRSG